MAGDNLGAVGPPGPVLASMAQRRRRKKCGLCPGCGRKTHKMRIRLRMKTLEPLNVPGHVGDGVCLHCAETENGGCGAGCTGLVGGKGGGSQRTAGHNQHRHVATSWPRPHTLPQAETTAASTALISAASPPQLNCAGHCAPDSDGHRHHGDDAVIYEQLPKWREHIQSRLQNDAVNCSTDTATFFRGGRRAQVSREAPESIRTGNATDHYPANRAASQTEHSRPPSAAHPPVGTSAVLAHQKIRQSLGATTTTSRSGAAQKSAARCYHTALHAATEMQERRFGTLTVFQASPLVWEDNYTKELHPIEAIDFDPMREVITGSLGQASEIGAEVDAVFETGTTELLSDLLASGCWGGACQALHFCCHGDKDGLYFEDGQGAAHPVSVDHLPDYIKAGGAKISFVFIFACHSRAVGEAFLRAGVRHVLCCRLDEMLSDKATTTFCRAFYTSLAWAKTLQDAFESGRQAVKMSPLVPNSENEMEKLILLPEVGTNHNVPVFYPDGRGQFTPLRLLQEESRPSWILVHPPRKFIGRERDMYEVLCRLQKFPLVRLTGPPGVGKGSLAAAVCHYIKARRKSFDIEEVMWLPLTQPLQGDELSLSLHLLFHMLQVAGVEVLRDCRKPCDVIIGALRKTNALIAIDAKGLNMGLSSFLNELFLKTESVKVILVCRDSPEVLPHIGLAESELKVCPLSFEHSATLFGTVSPFLPKCGKGLTPKELSCILAPEEDFSERRKLVFKVIGDGFPAKIVMAAGMMKKDQFNKLLNLCRIECISEFNRQKQKLFAMAEELKECMERCERKETVKGTLGTMPPLLVGVDFGPAFVDMGRDWAKIIVKNRKVIDSYVKDLLKKTEEFTGEDKVSWCRHEVKYVEDGKRENALVTLKVEIELPGDLKICDRCGIQSCCQSIAKVLRHAGVPGDILEDVMLGELWRGSMNLLLDAPNVNQNNVLSFVPTSLVASNKLMVGGIVFPNERNKLAPPVWRDNKGKLHPVAVLDFNQEFDTLRNAGMWAFLRSAPPQLHPTDAVLRGVSELSTVASNNPKNKDIEVVPHPANTRAQHLIKIKISLQNLMSRDTREGDEFAIEQISNLMLEEQGWKELQGYGLMVLSMLSRKGNRNKELIVGGGGLSAIVSGMSVMANSVRAQDFGCRALWSIVVVLQNRAIVAGAGGCSCIIQALEKHGTKSVACDGGRGGRQEVEERDGLISMIKSAMGAIMPLTADRLGREELEKNGAPMAVSTAMAAHPSVAKIQSDGCTILSSLVIDTTNQRVHLGSPEEFDAILGAMRAHSYDDRVQSEACAALQNYTLSGSNTRQLLKQLGKEGREALEVMARKFSSKCGDEARTVLDRLMVADIPTAGVVGGSKRGEHEGERGGMDGFSKLERHNDVHEVVCERRFKGSMKEGCRKCEFAGSDVCKGSDPIETLSDDCHSSVEDAWCTSNKTLASRMTDKLIDADCAFALNQCKMEGTGTFRFADGDVYEGQFKSGVMDGNGTLRYFHGAVYKGEWKGGVMNGRGTFQYPDGRAEVSQYSAGRGIGEGARWSADRETAHLLLDGKKQKKISLAKAAEIAHQMGLPLPE